MKKTPIIMALSLGFVLNCFAQRDPKAGFQIGFPNQSFKEFFASHPGISRILFKYSNDTLTSVEFVHPIGDQFSHEILNLTFVGDRYIFEKEYRYLTVPKPGKLVVNYLAGAGRSFQNNSAYETRIAVSSDSIYHYFNFFTLSTKNPSKAHEDLTRARLKGDKVSLQNKLNQIYKTWKLETIPDSVLIFTGLVEADGSLGKLKTGAQSHFSENVRQFILEEANKWDAAWQGTRSVRYQVKFFVRLNLNNSITLEML